MISLLRLATRAPRFVNKSKLLRNCSISVDPSKHIPYDHSIYVENNRDPAVVFEELLSQKSDKAMLWQWVLCRTTPLNWWRARHKLQYLEYRPSDHPSWIHAQDEVKDELLCSLLNKVRFTQLLESPRNDDSFFSHVHRKQNN